MNLAIKGLQEAQKKNLAHIRDLRTGSSVNKAVKYGVTAAHRASIPATPWDTSALRNSHRIKENFGQHRASVYIDPSAVNPKGKKPSKYGPYLHRQGLKPGKKGGVRAFYKYVFEKYGKSIAAGMARVFKQGFRK